MKGNGLRLGRVFGIELRLDYSWFILFVMLVWSLSSHYFQTAHPGWQIGSYWLMGTLTAILFFASVVGHEVAHSPVSHRQGVTVRDITLFIFGGAAHIDEEPKRPRMSCSWLWPARLAACSWRAFSRR